MSNISHSQQSVRSYSGNAQNHLKTAMPALTAIYLLGEMELILSQRAEQAESLLVHQWKEKAAKLIWN